jgi:hypothetical protein
MTPRLATTGPGDGARCPCRSTRPPRSTSMLRTVAARSAEDSCSPSRIGHRPRVSGRSGWPPAPRSSRPRRGSRTQRRRLHPVSYTPNAVVASARNCATPTSHQGSLEPDAVKAASPVLRRAWAQQCAQAYPTAPGADSPQKRPSLGVPGRTFASAASNSQQPAPASVAGGRIGRYGCCHTGTVSDQRS